VIEIRRGELADVDAAAVVRPISADGMAATAAVRRLELAAGPGLDEDCRRLGELPPGAAAITPAGALAADFVIHVVVRSREEPASAALVRRALQNALRRVAEWGIASVALPPLGVGAGNLDAEESAGIMIPLLLEHAATSPGPFRAVIVVDGEYELDVFGRELARRQQQAGGTS